MSDFSNLLFSESILRLDGGMGTSLQAMGLSGGQRPESWNLLYPERVESVHAAYLEAGAQVIASNTFGAVREHLENDAALCMTAGVRIALQAARKAGRGLVAVDMGSLGRLLQPYGDMPFEEAISQFREAFEAGIRAGGDLILIETMTDLLETKAAILAAREAMESCRMRLPLLVSLTFDLRGRLLSGADIPGTVAMVADLGVDGIGLNCGHEPKALRENVKAMLACSPLPVFVSPNASLPAIVDGQTVYGTSPEEFAQTMTEFALWGAKGLGGCCGTTPEHIRQLGLALKQVEAMSREEREALRLTRSPEDLPLCVSGRASSLTFGQRPIVIGERLNPTGKKRMKQALVENDMDYLLREAIAQAEAGADALDVNMGLPEIDEKVMLQKAVQAVQTVCDLPLQLDSANPAALEPALRGYAGKPLINSVSGKPESMEAVFPLAAKYGGAVVALCLDENGIPPTVEGRLSVARRILQTARHYGISKRDLLFDALTLTVASDPASAEVTLETVRRLHEELEVSTILGASNISFGLPQRPLLTAAVLAMAVRCGLSAAIMNPGEPVTMALFRAAAAVCGRDDGFSRYLAHYGGEGGKLTLQKEVPVLSMGEPVGPALKRLLSDREESAPMEDRLYQSVLRGVCGDAASAAQTALEQGTSPIALIEESMMPALSLVGKRYESGKLFLPQLLQSAAAAQAAFEKVKAALPEGKTDPKKKIVLATVKGDVHDIGKNIVKVLLQNYGFTVIDLGRDVAPEAVLDAVRRESVAMVGLSALMTTTVPAMEETVALLAREAPHVKVVVGGAVLSAEMARRMNAAGFGKDAMDTVRLCQGWAGGSPPAL